MKQKIIDIVDQDFGCEGRPEGMPVSCEVYLENGEKTILEEKYLIEHQLDVGSYIDVSNSSLL